MAIVLIDFGLGARGRLLLTADMSAEALAKVEAFGEGGDAHGTIRQRNS